MKVFDAGNRKRRSAAACSGNRLGRRNFLISGLAAGLGLNLARLFQLQAYGTSGSQIQPRAQSVIHIYLPGGLAQQESFDPKPFAPIEYRGDLGKVLTSTGEYFSGSLNRLAAIADKLIVIRSMTHTEAAHERGTHTMLTGYQPSPALVYPSLGSIVSHELGTRNDLPPYICVPNLPHEFAGQGYLSSAFAPFTLGADPAARDFRVRDLEAPPEVTPDRLERRREMLQRVNHDFVDAANDDAIQSVDTFYERAFALLDSAAAREAFHLQSEPEAVRDAYGRHPAGQRMLMARRLIEAGVRFVTLTYGSWDHHARLSQQCRNQLPAFDQALAMLLCDLDQRGMLDETIVMVTTEFGRTPKINADAGRDHWPRVFSVAVAGGGFARGLIYGSSNATAAEPEQYPVHPADLAATVYHLLGIDYSKRLLAMGNRPVQIVKDGKVLEGLLA